VKRAIIATLAPALAMLSTVAAAQTVNICDRTPAVRDAILSAIRADDCATVDRIVLDRVINLILHEREVDRLRVGDFDGLGSLRDLLLQDNRLATLPAGVFDGLGNLTRLYLGDNRLATLPAGVFADLGSLEVLYLGDNRLTTLPAGVFDSLGSLRELLLHDNRLTTLPAGVFADLGSLEVLYLGGNRLTTLPAGVFDSLGNLEKLELLDNRLTTLPAGVFDGPGSLENLSLRGNRLATLPAGVFADLGSLEYLSLGSNRLTTLPAGVFADLDSLRFLVLSENRLTTLPAGVFDGLGNLERLSLQRNRLATLPAGVFADLGSLEYLYLGGNHLIGLSKDDPVFDAVSSADIYLGGQTHAAAVGVVVSYLPSASHPGLQGFVRVINRTARPTNLTISAFYEAGDFAGSVEVPLMGNQVLHFNSMDLENGNPAKGIQTGIGAPRQGDWRLLLQSGVRINALAHVRTRDGFLTPIYDVLQKDAEGRLVAWTFNPASNLERQSRLRLVNTGAEDETVRIEGMDDQGNVAGPVSLTLAAGQSRTLTAVDLEEGAHGLDGTLGDGMGKWRLFITAGDSVSGMSLLHSASGHISNLSSIPAYQ